MTTVSNRPTLGVLSRNVNLISHYEKVLTDNEKLWLIQQNPIAIAHIKNKNKKLIKEALRYDYTMVKFLSPKKLTPDILEYAIDMWHVCLVKNRYMNPFGITHPFDLLKSWKHSNLFVYNIPDKLWIKTFEIAPGLFFSFRDIVFSDTVQKHYIQYIMDQKLDYLFSNIKWIREPTQEIQQMLFEYDPEIACKYFREITYPKLLVYKALLEA